MIRDLIAATGARLASLDHEMAREVARHLEQALGSRPEFAPPTHCRRVPACRALPALLDSGRADPVLAAVSRADQDLPWSAVARELCPGSFADGHAFIELLGPDGLLTVERVRMGLFLLAPRVVYPAHAHDAEELYLILAGTGAWQLSDAAFKTKDPGDLVHIAPGQPHAIEVGGRGVLTLWAWRGEIGFESYRYL